MRDHCHDQFVCRGKTEEGRNMDEIAKLVRGDRRCVHMTQKEVVDGLVPLARDTRPRG